MALLLGTLRRQERGVTFVEVLLAIVVAGALAAVAVPALTDEDSKESDSEAKAVAETAARAMEQCRAQHGDSYASCTKEALVAIEPSLADAGDRLSVASEDRTYEVGVASKRDPRVTFKVSRAADGSTARSCTSNGEWDGGCQVPHIGTW
jgi:Tfp pilus assembly protein PilE